MNTPPLMETHPLPPFLPLNARLLLLGSFPPPKNRWKMDFYYPNAQNDMWRILGLVFFGDQNYLLTADGKAYQEGVIREFLTEKGIAISDAGYRVIRQQGNASDKFLQVVEPVDLPALLAQLPECHALATTGDKATETLLAMMPPETAKPVIGGCSHTVVDGRALALWRLPSSSRAYPLPLAQKAERYRQVFEAIGLL